MKGTTSDKKNYTHWFNGEEEGCSTDRTVSQNSVQVNKGKWLRETVHKWQKSVDV